MLKRYAELQKIMASAKDEVETIAEAIKAEVLMTGTISAHGYTAKVKDGRKTINHEGAARAADVDAEIVVKHTAFSEPRTSWAKVTKEAKVPSSVLAEWTTQGPKIFVIEETK